MLLNKRKNPEIITQVKVVLLSTTACTYEQIWDTAACKKVVTFSSTLSINYTNFMKILIKTKMLLDPTLKSRVKIYISRLSYLVSVHNSYLLIIQLTISYPLRQLYSDPPPPPPPILLRLLLRSDSSSDSSDPELLHHPGSAYIF